MEEISYKRLRKYILAFMILGMICVLPLSSTNVRAWSASVYISPQSASRGETFTQSITIENTGSESMKVDEIAIHFGWMSTGEEYTFSGTPEVISSGSEATFTRTVTVPTDIYEGWEYDVETEITAYDPGFWGEWAISPDTKTYSWDIYIEETPEPTVSITSPTDGSEFSSDRVTVSWSGNAYSPESIDSYQINKNGQGWTGVGSDTDYTFTNLEDKTHTVEVKITDTRGESTTDSVTFVVDTSTPPSRPLNLQAVEKDGEIDLTWDVPNTDGGRSITQYRIYRGTSSGDMTLLTTVSSTSYIDEDVSKGETYYYEVSAVNSKGEGDTSEESSVTLSSEPSRPLNLQAVEKDGEIDLTWDVPNTDGGRSITQYRIYRGTSSGDMTLLTTVSSTSYTDEDVSEGETYYYEVSAVNSKGEGDTSEESSVTLSSTGLGDSIPNTGIVGFVISIIAVALFIELKERY